MNRLVRYRLSVTVVLLLLVLLLGGCSTCEECLEWYDGVCDRACDPHEPSNECNVCAVTMLESCVPVCPADPTEAFDTEVEK